MAESAVWIRSHADRRCLRLHDAPCLCRATVSPDFEEASRLTWAPSIIYSGLGSKQSNREDRVFLSQGSMTSAWHANAAGPSTIAIGAVERLVWFYTHERPQRIHRERGLLNVDLCESSGTAAEAVYRITPVFKRQPRQLDTLNHRPPGGAPGSPLQVTNYELRFEARASALQRPYDCFFACSENAAPWGSMALTTQSPPGTSIGPLRIVPPLALMRSTALVMSGTRK